MAVDATLTTAAPAQASVTGAIQKASRLTGTNFQYLLAAARVESNLNPNAMAKTSSAGGLFQFIEQTWFGTLKEAGASFGYARYANAIERTPSGKLAVADPAMRREILELRKDPTANAIMAGVFTNSNAAYLSKKLGRAPSEGELYIAHFLGAGGAAKLIGHAEATPGARAADAFPAAARANRSIFFGRDGRPRNFAEVTQNLTGRFQVARGRPTPPGEVPAATAAVQPAAPAVETARVARAYEAAKPRPADLAMPPVKVALAVTDPIAPARAGPAAAASQTPVVSSAAENVLPQPVAVRSNTAVRAAQAAADNEPVFHNPFRPRQEPVSSVVSERWITRSVPSSPAQAAAPAQPPVAAPGQAQTPAAMVAAAPSAAQGPTPNEVVQSAHANVRPRYFPRSDDPPLFPAQQQSDEPLGLFQEQRPNVRALFTTGTGG